MAEDRQTGLRRTQRSGKPTPSKKNKGAVKRRLIYPFESEAEVEEITSALRECVTAVSEAHRQIENNCEEINRLGEETRRLISELKAA